MCILCPISAMIQFDFRGIFLRRALFSDTLAWLCGKASPANIEANPITNVLFWDKHISIEVSLLTP